ncbi:hypothetical protein GCM10025778_29270 [Paeniglutamicibacter antarcticus]|uniref:Uncharacterized protein n=1 Tax=Paeniglutamicibacter antarcticus TaxID=494023 RepID=A0ABP9TQ25_9MICC
MSPVASTDRVSRYTQKVSANHKKLVTTFASAVLTNTCRNVRCPFAGGIAAADGELWIAPLLPGAEPSCGMAQAYFTPLTRR